MVRETCLSKALYKREVSLANIYSWVQGYMESQLYISKRRVGQVRNPSGTANLTNSHKEVCPFSTTL